jgi:hypothetical protein
MSNARKVKFQCTICATTLRAPEKLWGKQVNCPQCGSSVSVPAGSRELVTAGAAAGRTSQAAVSAAPAIDDDLDFLDDDPSVNDPSVSDDEFAEDSIPSRKVTGAPPRRLPPRQKRPISADAEPVPRRIAEKSSRSSHGEHSGFFGPERRALSYGPLGGLALMVLAGVWFIGGLAAGYIFFYPPVLFLVGLFGMFKSLFAND